MNLLQEQRTQTHFILIFLNFNLVLSHVNVSFFAHTHTLEKHAGSQDSLIKMLKK